MTGAHILVIEHESDAGIGILGAALRQEGAALTIAGPGAGRTVPDTLAGFDGLIVLGGTPGPVDDDTAPWLPAVRGLIAAALEQRMPYLGVCLGGQLLAVVAGGAVTDAVHPEIGVYELDLSDAGATDPLLSAATPPLAALEWHFLEVSRLPAGSVSLCRTARCENQAFRVGPCAWGVQFHLEADAGTAVRWARPERPNPDLATLSLTPADVVAPMVHRQAELNACWSAVARRWLEIVVDDTRARDDARREGATAV